MGFQLETAVFLFVVVFIGYTIQTMAGFGATVFSLPLSLLVVDRMEVLPVFLLTSVIQSVAVAYKDREFIKKADFLTMLVLAMVGMPMGILMGGLIPQSLMNIILGVFIISNSIISLRLIIKSKGNHELVLKKLHRIYPILSGFLQAAYGVGGPLIAAYMDKVTHNKRTYRSMMSLYWCILNPFVFIGYMLRGEVNAGHSMMLLLLLPAVILGVLLGNRTIDFISKQKFQIFVHSLLIIIGSTLFF